MKTGSLGFPLLLKAQKGSGVVGDLKKSLKGSLRLSVGNLIDIKV